MTTIRFTLTAFLLCVVATPPHDVHADENDTINFLFGGSVTRDDNVFRVPDASAPAADTINSAFFGIHVRKPVSQQNFELEATRSATRYQHLSNQNFESTAYRSHWDWRITSRFSGNLSADRNESLAPFEESGITQRNVRISENRGLTLDAWLNGGWHLNAGVSRSSQKSELSVQRIPDSIEDAGTLGMTFMSRANNSVSFSLRTARGKYLSSFSSVASGGSGGFRQNERIFNVKWAPGAKSTLSGQVAWLDRNNDDDALADFSSPSGNLTFDWTPTGKLRVNFAVGFDTSPWQDVSAGYRRESTFSVGPTLQLTAKTAVRAHAERSQSYYRGSVVASSGNERRDSATTFRLGASWIPLRMLTLDSSVEHQRRSSNDNVFVFDATIYSINASATF